MNSVFDAYTRQYPIQKTLRFELKPVGKTSEVIEEFCRGDENSLFATDFLRAEEYPRMKKVLDDYYRDFIDEVLHSAQLDAEKLKKAYALYVQTSSVVSGNNDATAAKEYEKIKEELRKDIAKFLSYTEKLSDRFKASKKKKSDTAENGEDGNKNKAAIFDYGNLFKPDSPLYKWLFECLKSNRITTEDYEHGTAAIALFNGYTVYFTKYQANRENLFSSEAKATAIAFRAIDENMVKYFENCRNYAFLAAKYPSTPLADELAKNEWFFMPENYAACLTQSGINAYNEIVGRKAKDTFGKGINQLINEHRQKNALKRHEAPGMLVLFKQLLSESDSDFVLDVIESDKDLFATVKEAYKKAVQCVGNIKTVLDFGLLPENLSSVFIRIEEVRALSLKAFKRWDFIDSALNMRREELGEKQFSLQYGKAISISALDEVCAAYQKTLDEDIAQVKFAEYFVNFSARCIEDAFLEAQSVLNLEQLDTNRALPTALNDRGGEGYEQLQRIKALLDAIIDAVHFYRPLLLEKSGKPLEVEQCNKDLYNEFLLHYRELKMFTAVYDKVRNYATRKPYNKDKFLINFNKPTFLDGWDLNKEESNLGVLLLRGGRYYLGVMVNNRIFSDLPQAEEGADCYQKMVYKQVSDSNKMFSKVFFAAKNAEIYCPDENILRIRAEKTHLKNGSERDKNAWIQFCIDCVKKHPEWNDHFDFRFKKPEEYPDIVSFYKHADDQMYTVRFVSVPVSVVDTAIDNGDLMLFEIYNKDFSPFSKGKPNLHTLYWKMLFDERNLKNIEFEKETPVFKLNGEAQMFYRKSSIPDQATHPAGDAIANKNPLNNKTHSRFEYDIKKDRRFMTDKLMFHTPMTLNYRAGKVYPREFNHGFNTLVQRNRTAINIIGIDRGERHLLYFTLIDKDGKILRQGSLNTVTADCGVNTDYRTKLDKKEKSRAAGRESWSEVESIKELKQGYMSQVVHMLATMMVENNAVVIMEDLNAGFKTGRKKVEKQVYQNFEKAMIEKLNLLVFKDRDPEAAGGCLNGYQLTAPFESFVKLGRQSGALYYVVPMYTSKICPATGFVNTLKPKYENVDKAKAFFSRFDRIVYNQTEDYFEFTFDYKTFGNHKGGKSVWTVCTHGDERYVFAGIGREPECVNVTAELKKLLNEYAIQYQTDSDLRTVICQQGNKDFWYRLTFLLKTVLQLRYTKPGTEDVNDYILSPVRDKGGNFFDSRVASSDMPKNADANGAYHIALKGKMLLDSIRDGSVTEKGKLADWLEYAQTR